MHDPTRQEFRLRLPGLLKVLAEHLYTSKSVAVRELIQNAHDSCLRRSLEDADFLLQARNALGAGELPGPIAGLVGNYLEDVSVTEDDLKGILYLNASCPLVQRLASSGFAGDIHAAVLTVIYQVARLFACRTLTPSDVAAAFHDLTDVLEMFLP